MQIEFLDRVPLWAFFIGAVILAISSLEGGYRYGRWRHSKVRGEKESPVGAMVGSILGLVAIMLAFTFNLAASRFDDRRQAVLEEANAIGTTTLRARLLAEPFRSETARLLKDYVDVRVSFRHYENVEQGLLRSEELQHELWTRGVAAAASTKDPVMTSLFLQSLNEVIDMHAKRVFVGLQSRLPASVWVALFLLVVVGMLSVGYQAGLSGTRRSPTEILLALSFAVVLFLIVDLDRAHEGLLRVSQQPMIDLQRSLQSTSPPNGR